MRNAGLVDTIERLEKELAEAKRKLREEEAPKPGTWGYLDGALRLFVRNGIGGIQVTDLEGYVTNAHVHPSEYEQYCFGGNISDLFKGMKHP